MGGGQTLEAISMVNGKPWVSYEVGGAVVALVVASYVFFGGMRGTAWVNTFQTLLFLCFGTIAFFLIARELGGFDQIMGKLAASPRTAPLLARDRIPQQEFFSYMFIPLSAIMFPHVSIMCLTAEKIGHFKKTVIFYPLCIAAIWLPSVYLGVVASGQYPGLRPGEADDVIIRLLTDNTNTLVAGILGAGIMACVMASDSQILALCTMFTEDVFAYYGGKGRFGDKVQIWTGRAFVVLIGIFAYVVAMALKDKAGIFELAIRFAFSGFAALAPVMLAALFWKRSTKWGALAACLWVTFCMLGVWWLTNVSDSIAPRPPRPAVTAPGMGGPAGAPSGAGEGKVSSDAPRPGSALGGGYGGGAGAPAGEAKAGPSGAPAVGEGKAGGPGPGGPGGPGGPPRAPQQVQIFPQYGDLFLRGPVNVTIFGFLPVMFMVIGSALFMILVSLLTPPPSKATIDKYFPPEGAMSGGDS
jgi:Na+(H+)/acetate symporter ActP